MKLTVMRELFGIGGNRGRIAPRAAAALLAAWLVAGASAQSIIDLGKLPGGTFSYAGPLSNDGSVVVGSGDTAGSNGKAHPWRWTQAGGLQDLGLPPGGNNSYGYGVSGDGLVVVGAGGSAYNIATRWTSATGTQSLGSLSPGQPSFAFDASFDGSVVVGDGYMAGTQRAFRWTSAGGLQPFGQYLAGTDHSIALRITPDGSVIIGYCFHNAPALVYPTACRWDSAGNVTSLGVLPGWAESVPGDVSADGSVVVGYCAFGDGSNSRAFRWTAAGGMQDLGLPAGAATATAGSVTADGATVAGHALVGADVQATIWTAASGQQYLSDFLQAGGVDLTGWVLRTANMSADGSAFAGWGVHNGVYTSWYYRAGGGCTSAPTISVDPSSQTVTEGDPVSFSVTASGGGLQYQWYKDNIAIPGAQAATYSIASAVSGDAGDYHCVVTNACGSTASAAATLTVQPSCTAAPVISVDPISQTVTEGDPVSFTVVASGGLLQFQWHKNSAAISGAQAATYSIASAAPGDAGDYYCVVSNACGSTTSATATLTVQPPPCVGAAIAQQPADQTVCSTGTAAFFVTATGTAPIQYRWLAELDPGFWTELSDGPLTHNGVTLAAVAGSQTASVQFSSLGQFNNDRSSLALHGYVENACGEAESATATLTVLGGGPAIDVQPADFNACGGDAAVFWISASGSGGQSYQWQTVPDDGYPNQWAAISDGPLVIDGVDLGYVSGSMTDVLIIEPPGGAWPYLDREYAFRCRVVGSCGSATSNAGYLLNCAACSPCDVNCDGSINPFDIQPFIDLLSGAASCSACAGDANGDGTANPFDIQGFVNCLLTP